MGRQYNNIGATINIDCNSDELRTPAPPKTTGVEEGEGWCGGEQHGEWGCVAVSSMGVVVRR